MQNLLADIQACQTCLRHLQHGCRPIVQASEKSRMLIIGQAPGKKVHETGIPWDDASGNTLRSWLGVEIGQFYDPAIFALMPMGFCYPGKGKSGDLPPRPECAPLWHEKLLAQMPDIQMTLLIGQYAQTFYLKENTKKTLTETVGDWQAYIMKNIFPLPHPSPLNFRWMIKNRWFETELVPDLRQMVKRSLENG